MGKIINLPRGRHFDIEQIPENLEELIGQDFREFTAGTAREYTFEERYVHFDEETELYLKAYLAEREDDDPALFIGRRHRAACAPC